MVTRFVAVASLLAIAAGAAAFPLLPNKMNPQNPENGQYAEVNGLRMYYEIHGPATGKPIVLLHGAFGTTSSWAGILPSLAKTRRVIAIELQGHGHTADRDAPLSSEQMADDTAALLKALKVEHADVFGYSMGGTVALALAIRHPDSVRRMAILGAHAGKMSETFEAESYKQFLSLPDDFAPDVLVGPYKAVAPDPSRWPMLVKKIKASGTEFQGFSETQMRGIKAPTLIMQGDRDGTKPEHAVQMFRWIPNAKLEIIPNADHFLPFTAPEKVLASLTAFLDAPDAAKADGGH